ncbi:MAG TPA: TIGR02757 family protein [Kiritimatiellia bacterium]|nr:TIGR02757 family protein [Kiritimatiellia bacterium]
MQMRVAKTSSLRLFLDRLYDRYNRPEYVSPDPLEILFRYRRDDDREVVGLLAALLAYGGVKQIIAGATNAVGRMGGGPAEFVRRATERELVEAFRGFRHRWSTGRDVVALLLGVRHAIETCGSLEASFCAGLRSQDETVLPALTTWVALLRGGGGRTNRDLLSCPGKGSACKRLNLFLRWMVRKDDVDPGLWRRVPVSKLVIPLDLHMFRVCSWLGFTQRRSADLRTAVEITNAFRKIRPDDPVRYDFALTRAAMRRELDFGKRVLA